MGSFLFFFPYGGAYENLLKSFPEEKILRSRLDAKDKYDSWKSYTF